MSKIISEAAASTPPYGAAASPLWETLETYAREQIQHFVQRLLEEEVEALLGRARSERRTEATSAGYRDRYGRPRKLALTSGTITVRRPRVRDMAAAHGEERFVSRVLPLFQRRTREVGALIPELYLPELHLHGLSTGDFELASVASSVTPPRSRPARSSASRPTGSTSTTSGAGAISRRCRSSTSGPTGST